MTLPISASNTVNAMLFSTRPEPADRAGVSAPLAVPPAASRSTMATDPSELILKSAMDKIIEVFKPYLGDGAIQRAAASGQDMSPQGVADSILSFATQLIGRAESSQLDLPKAEQSSREQLFSNVKTGVEQGFVQARDILESMQALKGDTKETVDTTHTLVQDGLSRLAVLLGVQNGDPARA